MKKIFTKNEILSEENFYLLIKKKKIVVFVPESHLDKVFSSMSDAGAGLIGDYDKCSFRLSGIGSFRPVKNTRSFSGKKNELSLENEIRLEMECNSGNLSSVVEAMLMTHPYEETAYEIYDFVKLDKNVAGKIINLNRKMNLKVILNRLNKKLDSDKEINKMVCKRILITELLFDNTLEDSAKFFESNLIMIYRENKFKLINLI